MALALMFKASALFRLVAA